MKSIFSDAFPPFFSRVVYWELRQVFPLILKLKCSGQISRGDAVEALSRFIKETFSCLEVILLDSGSSAIELVLRAFKHLYPQRDTVILPVYICPSVIRAVKRANMKPCFVSVGKDLTLIPESIKRMLHKNILAVLIPHIYGYPAKIAESVQLIKDIDPSIFIIDDAAPAFDTMVQTGKLGTWGDVGIFSFGPSKKLTATGGGALLVSNNSVLKIIREYIKTIPEPSEKETFRKFINFWWNAVCIRYSPAINYWYDKCLKLTPHASRSNQIKKMSNLDAALLLWLLKNMHAVHERRSQIMAYYIQELKNLPDLSFPQEQAPLFSVSRFYMRISGLSVKRNDCGAVVLDNPLVSYLRLHGIRAGYGYTLLEDDLDAEGNALWKEQHAWLDELIWLPVDHKKDIVQYDVVIRMIKSFFASDHAHF